jgi:hypothetical protein
LKRSFVDGRIGGMLDVTVRDYARLQRAASTGLRPLSLPRKREGKAPPR